MRNLIKFSNICYYFLNLIYKSLIYSTIIFCIFIILDNEEIRVIDFITMYIGIFVIIFFILWYNS